MYYSDASAEKATAAAAASALVDSIKYLRVAQLQKMI